MMTGLSSNARISELCCSQQTQAERATSAPGVDDLKAQDPEMLAKALAEKIQEVQHVLYRMYFS